jgi:hypothetical protein
MDNLEYIDTYFKGELPSGQEEVFDQRVLQDPAFAEEVAFYLSSVQAARNELAADSKKRFRELYNSGDRSQHAKPVRKLWIYIAAAAVVCGVIFSLYFLLSPVASPRQLADQYILEKFKTLGVTMGIKEDSLQTGLRLYNEEKFPEALQQFEQIIQSDTSDFTAKKYAGIASLRLREYDKALKYFGQLQQYTSLYTNPATFYTAMTLMERNQPGDGAHAKQLLQLVVQNNLEGKDVAQEWLRKL